MALDRLSDTVKDTQADQALPAGTTLCCGQYRVLRQLSSGGFGITYLAQDSRGQHVVLKECFVPAFCLREGTRIRSRSATTREHFHRVQLSFLDEARIMLSLEHPHILRMIRVFEDNATTYMVLPFVGGRDLLDVIDTSPRLLTPERIVTIAGKLIAALTHMHDNEVLHCDISPDNICLDDDGNPVLIDFGAARRVSRGVVQAHAGFSMVKDGYSPEEMYSSGGNLGPWSDVYGLGASLYHAVGGTAPVDSQARLATIAAGRPDPLCPLVGAQEGYPAGFLAAIDRAMAIRPSDRFTSARDWQAALAAASDAIRAPRLQSPVMTRPQPVAPGLAVRPASVRTDRPVILVRRAPPLQPHLHQG